MANRNKYPAQSYGIGREYIEFQLKLGGASAPTIVEGAEIVGTMTHSGGTNVIVVNLKDAFPKVVAHACDVRDDAGNGAYATIGSFTNESSTTVPPTPIQFKIQTFNSGGSALNDSTLVVVVTLAVRNSNVTAGN
jgi:hypothetical protein